MSLVLCYFNVISYRAHAQPIAQDMKQDLILPDGVNVSPVIVVVVFMIEMNTCSSNDTQVTMNLNTKTNT